jgi:regulator of RNase E activity RraA
VTSTNVADLSADTIALLRKASTATVTMQLLKRGLRSLAISQVRAVNPAATRMVGPAWTLRYIPGREDLTPPPKPTDPTNAQRQTVEGAPAGAVVVVSTGGELRCGTFGDILVARMMARGVAGLVSDGAMRDVPVLSGFAMPMFAAASAAPPSMNWLYPVDVQVPIGCGGVPVFPGDAVVSDADGVVIVPNAIAAEVARDAAEQERLESFIAREVSRGRAVPGLYPPNDETRAAYQRWLDAGEPKD